MFKTVPILAWSRKQIKFFLIEMEALVMLRKHFAAAGIENLQNSPKNQSLNVKNSTVFLSICLFGGLTILSSNEAESFDESIYIWLRGVSIGLCSVVYEIMVWNSTILYGFIDRLADTVNESK